MQHTFILNFLKLKHEQLPNVVKYDIIYLWRDLHAIPLPKT